MGYLYLFTWSVPVQCVHLTRIKGDLLPVGNGFRLVTCAVPRPGVPVIVTIIPRDEGDVNIDVNRNKVKVAEDKHLKIPPLPVIIEQNLLKEGSSGTQYKRFSGEQPQRSVNSFEGRLEFAY
jgi:hypothetical protein